jgi:hypothetical protein
MLMLPDALLQRDTILKLATEKFHLTPLINRFLVRIEHSVQSPDVTLESLQL